MNAPRREVELIVLAMFAAAPLYATQTISYLPLVIFHALLALMAVRVWRGRTPDVVPASIMRVLAVAYVAFYLVDLAAISHNAIAASTHLALFIAVYQPIEGMQKNNRGQRLLSAAMLFVASIATATHIAIVPYIVMFAFLMYRQLMWTSHAESAASIEALPTEGPSTRAAGFYVTATGALAIALFPMLPRVRNPFVPGMASALNNASTGLSDSIDFNEQRSISSDASVVSRVWMSREAVPFFTPLRLRGAVYDRFRNNEWLQSPRAFAPIDSRQGSARVARPAGFTRSAQVQQRLIVGTRLFLPVGTYAVTNAGQVYEGPTRDMYMVWQLRPRESITYDVQLARALTPLRPRVPHVTNYPITPPVAALAREIVGGESDPMAQAQAIETYLSSRFRYLANPAQIGHPMSVDNFLLHERRGHCEYFAAGMVALLTSLNVPARIVGGFYGGQLNPLTGYFVVRREDAHAWVEAWDGKTWQTFDPTPPSLRPGNAQAGLLRMYASALGDSINYFWDRYILTFGLADQIALISDALTRARTSAAALQEAAKRGVSEMATRQFLMIATMLGAAGALLILLARRRRPLFDLLAERLAALGIEVGPAMTMEEALAELRITRPDAAAALSPLIALYEEESFSPARNRARAAAVRRALAAVR
jgi:transglutaminase-like putative cysteine protease